MKKLQRFKRILSVGILLASVCAVLLACLSSPKQVRTELSCQDVPLDFERVTCSELPVPELVGSMQELSDFMDYCMFYGNPDDVRFAALTEEYAAQLREDPFFQYRWAGQYGMLAHNFAKGYDDSRLAEGEFGILGGITPYGFRAYELQENNIRVITLEYYMQVLSAEHDRDYRLQDFPLYQNALGFVKVSNSEQLFYAAAKGYMPVPENEETGRLLSKVLGILNRILKDGMTESEKVRTIYQYLICENTYDYESFLYKDSEHTDYSAYFLEGVFDSRNAVCDGLTKAMVLMCRLEGVEAYHIGAVGSRGGHAYVYLKADGCYYLCCPTSGSKVEKIGSKRYHCHTNSFLLTDYDTSSADWDYDSGQLPEIGEQIRQTKPYDHWSSYQIDVDGKTYTLAPETAEDAAVVLRYAAKLAEQSGCVMQVELLCTYSIADEAYQELRTQYAVHKINNGLFEGKKLYAFVFGAEVSK